MVGIPMAVLLLITPAGPAHAASFLTSALGRFLRHF
jgi:hypothetical protein